MSRGKKKRGVGSRSVRVPKDKGIAILLAVFLGFWTWLYTYQEDSGKFWVALSISVLNGVLLVAAFGLWVFLFWIPAVLMWVWPIVDAAAKDQAWYDSYPSGGKRGDKRQARSAVGLKPAWIAGAGVALAGLLAVVFVSPAGGAIRDLAPGGSDSQALRAVIVDQLSVTAPGQAFVDDATEQLQAAGYSVDYYAGEQITVDFYRTLPEKDYDMVLMRTHSTAVISRGDEDVSSVSLFTNEPYTKDKYLEEQQAGRVGFASYTEGGEQLFGITAGFIEETMKGRFDDTLIVMMGCDGLRNEKAAEAFIKKGASSFISWSQFVTAEHTDAATERLLEHLLAGGLPPEAAVNQTMLEVGPDPYYGALLKVYPATN